MKYLIGLNKPEGFRAGSSVSGCLCKWNHTFLLLKRDLSVPQGGSWCLPAGKLEKGESPLDASVRELFEETGIRIESTLLTEVALFYVRLPHVDYIFHLYEGRFSDQPEVKLSNEHTAYSWTTLEEALRLPLIMGGSEILSYVSER